jgi:hypothetical protein
MFYILLPTTFFDQYLTFLNVALFDIVDAWFQGTKVLKYCIRVQLKY